MATPKGKGLDRQAVLKKLTTLVKKHHKITTPKDRNVLETIVFAICLEDATVEQAEKVYHRLYHDLADMNEARVSSVSELESYFKDLPDADWRAYRFRSILQFVFEKNFSFEFETLKKKTLELAEKQLAKVKHLSPFVRNYTLQRVIGAHILPFDRTSLNALKWMGLVNAEHDETAASEALKGVIRKAEADQFCGTIRCIATDAKIKDAFVPFAGEVHDLGTSIQRLEELYETGGKAVVAARVKAAAADKKADVKAARDAEVKATKEAASRESAKLKKPAIPPAATTAAAKATPAASATKAAPAVAPSGKSGTMASGAKTASKSSSTKLAVTAPAEKTKTAKTASTKATPTKTTPKKK